MNDLYPKGVGKPVEIKQYSIGESISLRKKIPQNLLLRIYGTRCTGKRTLAIAIARTLGIPVLFFHTLLRLVIYSLYRGHNNPSEINIQELVKRVRFDHVQHELVPCIGEENIKPENLYSKFVNDRIDNDMFPSIRKACEERVSQYISEHPVPLIIVDSGAMPSYLIDAIRGERAVIQLLLQSDLVSTKKRYQNNEARARKEKNPEFEINQITLSGINADFEKDVILLDEFEIFYHYTHKNGLIEPDSYVVDTSELSPTDCVQSVLNVLDAEWKTSLTEEKK